MMELLLMCALVVLFCAVAVLLLTYAHRLFSETLDEQDHRKQELKRRAEEHQQRLSEEQFLKLHCSCCMIREKAVKYDALMAEKEGVRGVSPQNL